jgi:hypothetical protein
MFQWGAPWGWGSLLDPSFGFLYSSLFIVQSRTIKVRLSHILVADFFWAKLSSDSDSAGLKTSKNAFGDWPKFQAQSLTLCAPFGNCG